LNVDGLTGKRFKTEVTESKRERTEIQSSGEMADDGCDDGGRSFFGGGAGRMGEFWALHKVTRRGRMLLRLLLMSSF
jgi:hypothetical protein